MPKLRLIPVADETWTVSRIAEECIPENWKPTFDYCAPELEVISEIIEEEKKKYVICPQQKDLFRAFQLTPFPKIRVVILGQDPYPQILGNGLPRATGLSFSVKKTDAIPLPLQNIYTELKNNYPDFKIPGHGCLEDWARQGVLFLNTALTVRENEPGSHINIWQGFTRKVIRRIVEHNENVIFVLWGLRVQKLAEVVGGAITKLMAAYPSGRNVDSEFFGCGHFKEINDIFEKRGEELIDWNKL